MEKWSDFFVATAGASAALAGFIFVSVSISLKQILAFPKLPNRTLESFSVSDQRTIDFLLRASP